MAEHILRVADFTKYPGSRYRKDGPFSGEEFRETKVIPALLAATGAGDTVVINLDGAAGYPSSFLEEIFGGVVRSNIMPADRLGAKLQVRVSDPALEGFKADALKYFNRALSATRAA